MNLSEMFSERKEVIEVSQKLDNPSCSIGEVVYQGKLEEGRLEIGTKVILRKGHHRLKVGSEGIILGDSDTWEGCYIVRALEDSIVSPNIIESDVSENELEEIING